ncbi:helix-turn-helix domain-containing protein [Segetibacter sp. 3557_3]|uniref:hybrid sensor histidine kinase/response regulator transcription factor n=1 Tax=Segetibacter sp. 3557_3 TaxID=2547429 RepID=UPI001058F04D|nr:substrate-binding domain-containing protein [Segetibacter sp. 3557_3]TDH23239.1 helix-turn-helix domain-containing protein [Segetibacter sp. 3557_3]
MFFIARYAISVVLLLCTLLTACTPEPSGKQYHIGFSQCVESDAWRKTMLKDMKRELSFHPGIKLSYLQADGNSDKQISQVKELLNNKVDILIISANEAEPLTPIVEEAFTKGTPVIVVDRKIATPFYSAYVGGDNYEIGRMAGEYAINQLQGKGNIIEITGLPKSTPAIERDRGFTAALKNYPSIRIVERVNGEWYKQKAHDELSRIASRYKDINLIFAQNDVMAAGANEVYKSMNAKLPKIIGVDGLPCNGCGMQLVANKRITATMLYPTGGEEAIRIALKILNKDEFKREHLLNTTVIDSTNVRYLQLQANKVDSQQREIENQQSILHRLKTIYNNQRTFLYVLICSLVLALSLGGLVLYSLRENRRINRKLKQQNDEIVEQKDQLEEMSVKARAANEAKVAFFTNISHEFRTPLTLILGPLEELLGATKNQPRQTRNLNLIHKNVIRLLRLVNQLMDFRKIEVDKMRVQATKNDLIAFVNEIIESYQSMAATRTIDLRLITHERQLLVWYDVNMLDKVMFNLLSNAFKFTKDGGYVHIYVSKNEAGDRVVIRVDDNGIGMSEEAVDSAFELFYQGEFENHKGSGLGLALSKQLIHLHKGTITLSSQKWKGTSFEIQLLLGNAHLDKQEIAENPTMPAIYEDEKVYSTGQATEPPDVPEESQKKTEREHSILIIEDNEDLRGFLKARLEAQYEIVEADNGQSGLQQGFDIVPDLIISDVVIPGKDGMALVNIFKTDIRTSHIPIVLLTGKTKTEHQIEGMKNMADVYITKPFSVQFLEQTIKSLLSNRAMLKEHFTSEMPSNLKTTTVGKMDRKFMSEFTALVESNLSNEDFSVEEICKKMGISRVQLYRKVKVLLNVNVNDYILNMRLQKAKYLLQHEEATISEIAYTVGFSSPAYFSTVFKSKFGMTPKAFKEK